MKRVGLVVVLLEIVDPCVSFEGHELCPGERILGDVFQGFAFPESGLLNLGARLAGFLLIRLFPA